jgi:hypothetical protein
MVQGVQNMGNGGIIRGTIRSVGTFNTIIEQQKPEGGYLVLPNTLLMDKPIVVNGGEEPIPLEENLRSRAEQMNQKYEEQHRIGNA